jgi:hypothetical protein
VIICTSTKAEKVTSAEAVLSVVGKMAAGTGQGVADVIQRSDWWLVLMAVTTIALLALLVQILWG